MPRRRFAEGAAVLAALVAVFAARYVGLLGSTVSRVDGVRMMRPFTFKREALWLLFLTLLLPLAGIVFGLVIPWLARQW